MRTADKIRWLKKENAEWQWVCDYIEGNASPAIAEDIRNILENKEPSHEVIEEIIRHLTGTERGRDFIKRLRNALRQHRYRSSENGKIICTFALPTKTKKALRKNAEKQSKSESELVDEALNQSETLIEEYRQREQRLEKARELERKRAKQRIELLSVKHHEAMRQIQMLATRLSIWELALGAEPPDISVDQTMLADTAKEKTKAVKKAIKTAVTKWDFLQTRV
ncbi:hypothetical protein L4O78_003809 [Pseudomonas aeruginosa]|uniref:hypothetical protein n=1 Tax=Pseudomonas aeruginosa TaxID=287 RepID=UPI00265FB671|nr:hypothetical protein [Pseudomonas aeruginosa]EIU2895090.1 hypothetical protein [Pseudomonas aeruginosa]EIU2921235.1 hypothetical protein [Pseudomonas aeruginosa]EKU2415279.1 hypothetical protein [Pseudomonas aeruginosa]EKU3897573.1 hypothetical protein [Pseudomonas aeruginosa]EKU7564174.1 hypothetical protein [Pseudomonas aeruginosa]